MFHNWSGFAACQREQVRAGHAVDLFTASLLRHVASPPLDAAGETMREVLTASGLRNRRRKGGRMTGYSGTPLAKKLGVKPGCLIALIDAPPSFPAALEPLPSDVSLCAALRGRGPFDVILCFTPDLAALNKHVAQLAERLRPAGGLWIAWPKKASGVATDLTEDVVRAVGLEAGLVDNKVCAVNETWSGLRFVYRLKDRAAHPT